ncbi:MAG: endonuclease MutS2 [[Eubacterium] sulci]|nr:endonuclease MutS2 [[Eubacterium] sulci]MBF1181538.1 endonuclease MutS2 [[Eubacterium] sulci]
MNQKALETLEYKKIIAQLKREMGSAASAKLADELTPLTSEKIIKEELRSTTEAVDLIVRKGPLPTGGLYDIREALLLAKKGGSLTMRQLLEVQNVLGISSEVVAFMHDDALPELKYIGEMVDLIVEFTALEKEISRCILTEDEMADNASPKLKDIRRNIHQQNQAIKNKLSRIITSSSNKTYLQDAIVTMRDGRYVIPVKQEYRSFFPGMVHDQSKGGATLFIEPQGVVELNNKLRELEVEEQLEIARILAELSSRVAEHYREIRSNLELLTKLDFIMAKGKLSCKMHASEPKIDADGELRLISARHPLIEYKKAVPVDIRIGGDHRTLIITGPNTGGKTVSLKTAGLLVMMAQSGLHIPASHASTLPIFGEVFADIGDEQSIEQSLSTFSSHMKNIVSIIDKASYDSLVLVDELGAGTDPTEGAALAIAILERFYDSGALTMATTHYNELKKYALATSGVENAAMEFDVETLTPTYRLLIGVPGKSNAFEISKKLGLSESVIERASEHIKHGDMEFENVISSIEDDKRKAAADRLDAESMRAEIEERLKKLEEKEKAISEKRADIIAEAKREARELLRETKSAVKDVQKDLRRLQKSGAHTNLNTGALEKSRRKINEAEDLVSEIVVKQVNSEPVSADTLKIGDRVKLLTIGQNGTILSLPDEKGNLMINIGALKVKARLQDLMLINEGKDRKPQAKSSSKYGSLLRSKSSSVSASINVRGKNLDDALADVEKYLDDVYMAGLDMVSIIHGRGGGILKDGIRQMLKRKKYVDSYGAASYNDGGEGVTVVRMKKK